MKKTFLPLLILMSPLVCSVNSQNVKKMLSVPSCDISQRSETATEASYELPVALSNIGTISMEDDAVCNYLFPNKEINGDAYILASGNKPVSFLDKSKGNPTEWLWNAPGTAETACSEQNLKAQYTTEGVFDFPSLTVTTSNGKSTYAPNLKIKSGGTSEITAINTRKYNETYQFGAFAYGNNGGFVGGTNNLGIVGWGNFFMFGTDDAYMEGVNLYLHHKPKKYPSDAKILVQVWYPRITENEISFTALPLEGEYVKMEDIKDASDGVYVATEGGAVAQVRFSTPLDLYGKTMLFISVEGFGSDPEKEDFCLLTDVMGAKLDEMEMSNMLAHNSFGRMKGENDYLRPISYYGGGTGCFAICPVIRTQITSHVEEIKGESLQEFKASFDGDRLNVTSACPGKIMITDLSGRVVQTAAIAAGNSTVAVKAASGVYIIKSPCGKTLKIRK